MNKDLAGKHWQQMVVMELRAIDLGHCSPNDNLAASNLGSALYSPNNQYYINNSKNDKECNCNN
eukprot:4938259-Amphidinium_carterae.1